MCVFYDRGAGLNLIKGKKAAAIARTGEHVGPPAMLRDP
jgi:hypothetical protein